MNAPDERPTVSVIGLGPMGDPIARNLVAAGHDVTVWNRTPAVSAPFKALGARVAERPADAAADVMFSVLPDVDQLVALIDGETLDAWASAPAARLVVMSTTSPGKIHDLASRLIGSGIRVVDAPMSGGDKGARNASLSIMVGAEDSDWELISPILADIASTVERFGAPGAGSIAKLCNQIVVAGTLTALAEAFSLAEHTGLDPEQLCRVLTGGLASSAVLDLKGRKLLDHEYSLGGSASNQLKDLRYAAEAAQRHDAPAPLTELLTTLFQTVDDRGLGDDDHSVVFELYRAGFG